MIKSWLAGDTSIKQVKHKENVICAECGELTPKRGNAKCCRSCSDIHSERVQREYRRGITQARKLAKENQVNQ